MMEIIQYPQSYVGKEYGFLKRNHPKIFQIHSHTNAYEKSLIHKLARSLPAGSSIVEIGAHLGATSLAMGVAAREIGGQVICVDTWDNRTMSEGKMDTYLEWYNNTRGYPIGAMIFESKEAAKHLQEQQTDHKYKSLIFFDADHSYEGITGDIRAWLPLCMPGCYLIFHDHSGPYGRPAIRQAVEELIYPVQDGPGNILESVYWCRYGGK